MIYPEKTNGGPETLSEVNSYPKGNTGAGDKALSSAQQDSKQTLLKGAGYLRCLPSESQESLAYEPMKKVKERLKFPPV